jgi:signal transduction histidine kinase
MATTGRQVFSDLTYSIASRGPSGVFLASRWKQITDDEKLHLIQAIDRQARSLDRLVNDLLMSSRLEAGTLESRPEDVSVDVIVRDVLAVMPNGPEVTAGRVVDAHVQAGPEHIRRILLNLIVNARRCGAPPIELRADERGGEVELRVSDSGAGVPHHLVSRLFDSFVRGNADETRGQERSGLGLAIVKRSGLLCDTSSRHTDRRRR